MNTTDSAGSAVWTSARWTRWLAADLFPGTTLPFAWSVLQTPLEHALRRSVIALGATEPSAGALWRLAEDGRVYLSAGALTEADQTLKGAAWLGPERPEQPAGLVARWGAQGTIRRAHARVSEAQAHIETLHGRLHRWLHWVRERRWAQADLLQVMEELEPHATDALQACFTLSAGLRAATARVSDLLADLLPDAPPNLGLDLYVGLADLPSVTAAYELKAAAVLPHDHPGRAEALARHGHRGPGEMRPDARRWADAPALLNLLAELPVRHPAAEANRRRADAEDWISGRLAGGRRQKLLEAVTHARKLCRAADLAWDMLTMVLAAAQSWLSAAAAEACNAGLLEGAEDALFLELEELKQVATGEWHRGRREEVQALVAQRRNSTPSVSETRVSLDRPVPASAGAARGIAMTADGFVPPSPAAIWLVETADPGWGPFWLGAEGILVAGNDPWSPGTIVARALGVPAVAGAVGAVAGSPPEKTIAFDGATGHIITS